MSDPSSESSLPALTYAAAFAKWYDAHLTVLQVVPSFEPLLVRSASLMDPVRMVDPMPREEATCPVLTVHGVVVGNV